MTDATPVFDPATAKLTGVYDSPGTLYAVCLDEPRRVLYGAGSDGGVYAVDLTADKPQPVRLATLHENYVSSLAIHTGTLISCGYDRKLAWFDLASRKPTRVVDAHDGWVRKLVLFPDGQHLATIGDDMLVKVRDSKGQQIASLSGHERQTPEGMLSALYALAVSPDGKLLASGDRAGFIRVWDLASRKTVSAFRATELYTFDARKRARGIGGVRGLAFAPDGKHLAASGIGPVTNVDGFVGPARLELWDWQAGKRLGAVESKHQAILNHVAFGPRAPWLIAAGGGDGGGALCFWDPTGTAPPHLVKPKGHLQSFVLDSAGTRLHAVGHGGFQQWTLG